MEERLSDLSEFQRFALVSYAAAGQGLLAILPLAVNPLEDDDW